MKKEQVSVELETENGCVVRTTFSAIDVASLDPDVYQRMSFEVISRCHILTELQWRGLCKVTAEYLETLPSSEHAVQDKAIFIRKLNRLLEDLDLSVRVQNCFQSAGIKYVGELVRQTEQEMLKSRNFGRKGLSKVKEALEGLGLSLGMADHPLVKGWKSPVK